ncbi:MAG: HTTM domain-containing protein [Planctomycetaceae bacterium]|nr:HTTM domain-containing protein [Planctomycetaceae bacterium]
MNAPLPLAASDEQEPMFDNDFEESIDDVSHLDTRNDGGSNIVSRYLTDLAHQSAETWNRFWYTPTDPATLGLIRLLTGLMLVYTHWVWGLDFESFFGPESWVNSELVQRYQQDSYVFSLWFLVPYEYAFAVHMMCVGILGLFALGVFTRVTSILSLLIVISYSNRLPTAQYGLDQANGLLTLYLAIGPSGAAYSIDSWLRRARGMVPPKTAEGLGFDSYGPSIHANIAIRLIQIHMCVIYLFAGLGKLQGDAWWDGLAMWMAFSNREYQTVDMLWLSNYPWLIHAMTHVTILWEVSYCALVWVPILRPIVLLMAVVTHVGIGLCMGMWTFAIIMMVGNMAFVPPHMIRNVVHLMTTRRHRVKSFSP